MKWFVFILFIIVHQSFAQIDTITIFFEINRHEASAKELEKLVIQANWRKVDIVSYTDYLGSKPYNNKLSLERSREIRSRLVQRGLNTEILGLVEGRGMIGETLNSNIGIQQNRRTDVIVYTSVSTADKNNSEIKRSGTSEIKEKSLAKSIAVLSVGDHLALKKISFIGGRHFPTLESKPYLDSLLKVLINNPSLNIAIEGHICCTIGGSDGLDWDTQTYTLSTERAKYVYHFLVTQGIDASRLAYRGFARERPIYPNELNEEQKQANRRVEIKIVAK